MRLLLDTHAFIWLDADPEKLSDRASGLCHDPENELFLSVASLWEIQIKSQLGKLKLKSPLRELVNAEKAANGLLVLPIRPEHTYALDDLPCLHKDPFDRMIVAQARTEELRVVSHDAIIKRYPVDVEW